jgi:hypothetical protein
LNRFNRAAAERCFDEHPPSPEGAKLARYWLSLWRDDQLPMRAAFEPRIVGDILRSISIFDVIPGESVRCRLAGTFIVEGAGQDITGADWLEMTRPAERPVRLSRFSEVANGAIGRGMRTARRASGELQMSEEIMLPFADIAAGGARQVLTHIAWRPTLYDPTITGVGNTGGLLVGFTLTPLASSDEGRTRYA